MDTERVKFIQHQDKDILLLDFSNSKTEEVLKLIDAAKQIINSKAELQLLTLTDVTNTLFCKEVGEEMKYFTLYNSPFLKASAVVGISGLKKIILGAIKAFSPGNFEAFDDREEAKSWLVNN
jgi:hypothetical protein